MTTFGERIESLRAQRNLSRKDAAHDLGIPQSRYSELERGIRVPTEGQIERMARYYEADAGELNTLASNIIGH